MYGTNTPDSDLDYKGIFLPSKEQIFLNRIPFTRPSINYIDSVRNIIEVLHSGELIGNGRFTNECNQLLQVITGSKKVLITNSATTALEMSAILANIKEGDEIIMPSFTFVSTANAFVLRGAVPVFVDIRNDTLNINENKIEEAITDKTKAIVPVHYAGAACEIEYIKKIADKYGLLVIEDAAQCIYSYYEDKHLGSIGDLGVLSFHGSKNVAVGECGALLINNHNLIERAQIIWEKGTNRIDFDRKKVDKYSWIDIGSSYVPNEITSAFLLAQLSNAKEDVERRKLLWSKYYSEFIEYKNKGILQLPPERYYYENHHNSHIFWFLVFDNEFRNYLLRKLKEDGIEATAHYVPLHTSPFGKKYYRNYLQVTEDISDRLIRLPLHNNMSRDELGYVSSKVKKYLS